METDTELEMADFPDIPENVFDVLNPLLHHMNTKNAINRRFCYKNSVTSFFDEMVLLSNENLT